MILLVVTVNKDKEFGQNFFAKSCDLVKQMISLHIIAVLLRIGPYFINQFSFYQSVFY